MGAHSTARTNVVSAPRHCARDSTASGGCLARGSPAMAAARATPAGCGGGGTVTTRTSALVARCPQRASHESSPESSPEFSPDRSAGVPSFGDASSSFPFPGFVSPRTVGRADPPVRLSRVRSLCFNRAMARTPSAVSWPQHTVTRSTSDTPARASPLATLPRAYTPTTGDSVECCTADANF